MSSAGSAIGQRAGKIAQWDNWKPWDGEYLWFLMGGAMDPPESVHVSSRKPRDAARSGKFLDGMQLDLRNMQQALIKANLQFYNSVSDLHMTKYEANNHLRKFFIICSEKGVIPVIYYTGHGQTGTGNWCFSDGTISIGEIENMVPFHCRYPLLISDACFSGHWANYCLGLTHFPKGSQSVFVEENPEHNDEGMHCLAASPEYATALDTKDHGGEFTKWMTGGKRPSTEPMWSMGCKKDYPISPGYNKIDYTEFISSHIKNSKKLLISQMVVDNTFTGLFAADNLHNRITIGCSWQNCLTRQDLGKYIVQNLFEKENRKYIYSLASDGTFGFGVFGISGFGDGQILLSNDSSELTNLCRDISKYWLEDYKITAVGAKDDTFYVVMTHGTIEFYKKAQVWFARSTWNEVLVAINEGYTNSYPRKILTGICYSSVLQKYLFVLTESNEDQDYKCTDDFDFKSWKDEKFRNGYYPIIVFKANEPGAKYWMFATTKSSINSSDCMYRFKYLLK